MNYCRIASLSAPHLNAMEMARQGTAQYTQRRPQLSMTAGYYGSRSLVSHTGSYTLTLPLFRSQDVYVGKNARVGWYNTLQAKAAEPR